MADPPGRPIHVAQKPVMAWALIHIPRPRGANFTTKAIVLAWTTDKDPLAEVLWYASDRQGFQRTWIPARDVRRRNPTDEKAPADLRARLMPRPPTQPEWPGPGP